VSVDDPRTSGRYEFVHIFRTEAGGQDELLPRFQNHKQKMKKSWVQPLLDVKTWGFRVFRMKVALPDDLYEPIRDYL